MLEVILRGRPNELQSQRASAMTAANEVQDLCLATSFELISRTPLRAELKVTHLRWRSPICGFLRFSAKICGFLRKSAVFCGFLRPPNPWFSRRIKGWICENLRFSAKICVLGSLCHLSSVPLSAPRPFHPCQISSERAKGAEKASCGETVVQKCVFGESVSSLPH